MKRLRHQCSKHRAFTFLIVAIVMAAPRAQAAASAAEQLLLRLHAQLGQIRSTPSLGSAPLQRPQLTPLLGARRSELARSLGAPDWCRPPSDDACSHSRHWTYFFYRWQPSSRAASEGITEVTMPTAGWAVEVDFTGQSLVAAASWVQQR
jgi:hypothetical protein